VFFAPQRWRSISAIPLPVLGFREDDIREGALAEVGQGSHTTWWRGEVGSRLGVVWAPGGSPGPFLLATSVFWQNRNFWVFSENC
jgi:hypothetical protein